MSALKWVYLRLACTCEETCLSVWVPNASLYPSSTCRYLRFLASPFGQGLRAYHPGMGVHCLSEILKRIGSVDVTKLFAPPTGTINFILKQHTLYTKYFIFFHSNTLKSTTNVSAVDILRFPFNTSPLAPSLPYHCGMVCVSKTHMRAVSWNLVLLVG